ncbi:MAG: aminotransferase class I/II-fold pyridoxal phosphate-dependent enzyme, partial [Bauldia sp.]
QAALARRRDVRRAALTAAGYGVLPPEGTFYLWVRWPQGDAARMWETLADSDVFVMPGSVLNAEGWFRISLTASDAMVERALPVFATAAAGGKRG